MAKKSGSGLSYGDAEYNAGGSGLLGSRAHDDIKEWERFFGVEYKGWDDYDHDNSYGAFSDWYETATPEEREAARTYTGSAYTTINDYLRSDKLSDAPQWVKDAVRNNDKASAKFYLPEAITVWRGGSDKLIGGAKTVEQINAMKGAIVVDRGITSTAVTKDASWINESNMGYEIVYPKGRGRGIFIDPISKNHGEQEFMASRKTSYEVIGGYTDAEGHVICQLKAVYGRKARKK